MASSVSAARSAGSLSGSEESSSVQLPPRGADADGEGIDVHQRRRRRGLLQGYYGVAAEDRDAGGSASGKASGAGGFGSGNSNPTDVNSPNFEPEKYLSMIVQSNSLSQLLNKSNGFVTEIKELDSDMQTLVYENYNKFISATDTIRKMKSKVGSMEEDMDKLSHNIGSIIKFSNDINSQLLDKREKIARLAKGHTTLKKLQFLFELPSRLEKCMQLRAYGQAVRYYSKASGLLLRYKHLQSFEGIYKDCEVIVGELKRVLRQDLEEALMKEQVDGGNGSLGGGVDWAKQEEGNDDDDDEDGVNGEEVIAGYQRKKKTFHINEKVQLLLLLGEPSQELSDMFLESSRRRCEREMARLLRRKSLCDGIANSSVGDDMKEKDEAPGNDNDGNAPVDILEFVRLGNDHVLRAVIDVIIQYKNLFLAVKKENPEATVDEGRRALVLKLYTFVLDVLDSFGVSVVERFEMEILGVTDNALLMEALTIYFESVMAIEPLMPPPSADDDINELKTRSPCPLYSRASVYTRRRSSTGSEHESGSGPNTAVTDTHRFSTGGAAVSNNGSCIYERATALVMYVIDVRIQFYEHGVIDLFTELVTNLRSVAAVGGGGHSETADKGGDGEWRELISQTAQEFVEKLQDSLKSIRELALASNTSQRSRKGDDGADIGAKKANRVSRSVFDDDDEDIAMDAELLEDLKRHTKKEEKVIVEYTFVKQIKQYAKNFPLVHVRNMFLGRVFRYLNGNFIRHYELSRDRANASSASSGLILILSRLFLELKNKHISSIVKITGKLFPLPRTSTSSGGFLHEIDSRLLKAFTNDAQESAQKLLDHYVEMFGMHTSQMIRKSIEVRDWLTMVEPRTVRPVMKRVAEDFRTLEAEIENIYPEQDAGHHPKGPGSLRSLDSSRQGRMKMDEYSGTNTMGSMRQDGNVVTNGGGGGGNSGGGGLMNNIQRLFTERIEIFGPVKFEKQSIMTGVIKIVLKSFFECVRLKTFSRYGLQQIEVDSHYIRIHVWNLVQDEDLVNFLLNEVVSSAEQRCVDPLHMEMSVIEAICER